MCENKCIDWLYFKLRKTLEMLNYLSELFRQIRRYWAMENALPCQMPWVRQSYRSLMSDLFGVSVLHSIDRIPEAPLHGEIRTEWTFSLILSPASYCGELSARRKRAWFHSHSVCQRQCDCCQTFWSEEMLFKSWESCWFFFPPFLSFLSL